MALSLYSCRLSEGLTHHIDVVIAEGACVSAGKLDAAILPDELLLEDIWLVLLIRLQVNCHAGLVLKLTDLNLRELIVNDQVGIVDAAC